MLISIATDDFNKKLNILLCEQDEYENLENNCLISNNKLEKDCITLICGHKFNYSSILNEIKNQKKQNLYYETQKLKSHQIKCPYCRRIQNGLLPYREGYPTITYVNWPRKLQFLPNICEYIFKSGKRKGEQCDKRCCKNFCPNHEKIMKRKKEREAKKNKFLKDNVIEKAKKYVASKLLQMEEHAKNIIIPPELNIESNQVILNGSENDISNKQCQYIFKKGIKKGKLCKHSKCNNYTMNYCKTHYKYLLKKKKLTTIMI